MITCSECAFWKARAEGESTSTADRTFGDWDAPVDDAGELMDMPFHVRYCTSPLLLFYERPVEANEAAVVDGSRYFAALITGPDFGCVNAIRKPATPPAGS